MIRMLVKDMMNLEKHLEELKDNYLERLVSEHDKLQKQRDKWIDEARKIEKLPQGEDHDYCNYQTRCEEFVEKISKETSTKDEAFPKELEKSDER